MTLCRINKMNYKIIYYNIHNIEQELEGLEKHLDELTESFNSLFINDAITYQDGEPNDVCIRTFLNALKNKFSTLLILNKEKNEYIIIPVIILRSSKNIFIIYSDNNNLEKNIKLTIKELNYNLSSPLLDYLQDYEIVNVNYETGKTNYIYQYLLLKDKRFYKIKSLQ